MIFWSSAPRLLQSGADFGIERQRAVEALERLFRQAGGAEQGGAVAVRLGETGVGGDGRVEGLDRLEVLAQPLMRLAQEVVHARLRGTVLQRLAAELDALLELLLLAGDHGDVIERVGIVRIDAQHVGIPLHGLGEVALAVVEQALLDQRGGGGGLGHGGSLLGASKQAWAGMPSLTAVVLAQAGTQ